MAFVSLLALCAVSCRDASQPPRDLPAGGIMSSHGHVHIPPHGGFPVILGNEVFHLEFVLDSSAGSLTAYVLDGHMDRFVRIEAPEFSVAATAIGTNQTLLFRAVANSATGETVGQTAQFSAQADWLKTTRQFAGTIPEINIRGRSFTNVVFQFQKPGL